MRRQTGLLKTVQNCTESGDGAVDKLVAVARKARLTALRGNWLIFLQHATLAVMQATDHAQKLWAKLLITLE